MTRRLMVAMMMWFGAWSIPGCGDDSSGSSGSSIQKCDTLIDAACTYYARCEELAGNQTQQSAYNECLTSLQQQNKSCSEVSDVKDSYDVCLSKIKAGACPFKSPPECQHVLSPND